MRIQRIPQWIRPMLASDWGVGVLLVILFEPSRVLVELDVPVRWVFTQAVSLAEKKRRMGHTWLQA